ncbi:MAG TPA: PhzF family phenazine biosynthesis protein [Candidatus Limnocylindrales bacterium]|nr:PhzF family phenazine biosynthesis protein [Candidatus Limnocylindrales bacterium]
MEDSNLYIVDAFTDQPFRGNPAGVMLLSSDFPADSWMQTLAAELRHSETAFVRPRGQEWELRWFTPTAEVDLCGHATLATAHVLGGDNVFHTRSGVLRTTATGEGWIRMDFPADPPSPIEYQDVLDGMEVSAAVRGVSDILVRVASADHVRSVQPDMEALAKLPARGIIVTALGDGTDGEADIVSRCFYPAFGVPEDPVTGSAHCTLAGYWCPLLGRDKLVAQQLSPRGGTLRLFLDGDRVHLEGRAVTILAGRIQV